MPILKHKKGLTVIEVLVTLLIVAIIFGMVASIVGFFSRFSTEESQHVRRQEEMRLVMLQIERDIRMSDQRVDVSVPPCFSIGTATVGTLIHRYCFNSETNTLTRNGTIIARSVQFFTIRISNNELVVEVRMLPSPNRRQLSADLRIFLRLQS